MRWNLNDVRHDDGTGNLVGIQHRDIKPANIFLLQGSVKVADFGLAKILKDTVTGHTGTMTPHYAPPEMFHGEISSKSDQYSLGVTYLQLRTGKLPFNAQTITQLMYQIVNEPPDLSHLEKPERLVVQRALAKQPSKRFPNSGEFVKALRQIQPHLADISNRTTSRFPFVQQSTEPEHTTIPSKRVPDETVALCETEQSHSSKSVTAKPKQTKQIAVAIGIAALLLAAIIAYFNRTTPFPQTDPNPIGPAPAVAAKPESEQEQTEEPTSEPPTTEEPEETKAIAALPKRTLLPLEALLARAADKDPFAGKEAGQERQLTIGIPICWCPAGSFVMGSPPSEPNRYLDENQVKVTISKGFWIGKYEVTAQEYHRLMDDGGPDRPERPDFFETKDRPDRKERPEHRGDRKRKGPPPGGRDLTIHRCLPSESVGKTRACTASG